MASRIQNITIDQGADYAETFVAYSSKSATAAQDITNYTANSDIRKSYYHANSSMTFSTEITFPTEGKVKLTANNLQTSALAPGRYVYDINVSSGATVYRIVSGNVMVNQGISTAL